jgi:hypothetical protein
MPPPGLAANSDSEEEPPRLASRAFSLASASDQLDNPPDLLSDASTYSDGELEPRADELPLPAAHLKPGGGEAPGQPHMRSSLFHHALGNLLDDETSACCCCADSGAGGEPPWPHRENARVGLNCPSLTGPMLHCTLMFYADSVTFAAPCAPASTDWLMLPRPCWPPPPPLPSPSPNPAGRLLLNHHACSTAAGALG